MKALKLILAGCLCIVLVLNGCTAPTVDKNETQPNEILETTEAETASNQTVQQSTGNGSSDIIEPEQLISRVEAEAILGSTISSVEKTEQQAVGQKLCFYDTGNDGYLQIGITQQAFMPANSPNTPKSIYDGIKSAFPEAETVDFGEEAFLATGGYNIMQNGYFITVSAGNTSDEAVVDLLNQTSDIAVNNLLSLLKN
jgi:hypothetical protein